MFLQTQIHALANRHLSYQKQEGEILGNNSRGTHMVSFQKKAEDVFFLP